MLGTDPINFEIQLPGRNIPIEKQCELINPQFTPCRIGNAQNFDNVNILIRIYPKKNIMKIFLDFLNRVDVEYYSVNIVNGLIVVKSTW